jgi:hypothetical protein
MESSARSRYYSARRVFSLLRQPNRIGLLRVPGFHGSNDVEASLDWLDIQFGRSTAPWNNKPMFEWSRAQWLKDSGEHIDPNRYPAHSATGLLSKGGAKIASAADWEKAAAGIRAAINGMIRSATCGCIDQIRIRFSRWSVPATPSSPLIRPDSAAAWESSRRSTNGILIGL